MSWFSSALGGIKNAAVGVGHLAGQVASNPLVDAGIGAFLGPGAAAAAGGLGHLIAPGGNIGNAAGGALSGYLAGAAGSAARGALGGAGGLSGNLSGLLKAGAGLAGGLGGAAGGAGSYLSSALGGGSGGGSGGPGLSPLQTAMAAAQTANAAQLGAKANSYSDQAMKSVNDSYNSRAPLRAQGIQQMLHPTAPDLSALSNLRRALPVAAQAGGNTGTPQAPIPLGGGILSRALGGAQ